MLEIFGVAGGVYLNSWFFDPAEDLRRNRFIIQQQEIYVQDTCRVPPIFDPAFPDFDYAKNEIICSFDIKQLPEIFNRSK